MSEPRRPFHDLEALAAEKGRSFDGIFIPKAEGLATEDLIAELGATLKAAEALAARVDEILRRGQPVLVVPPYTDDEGNEYPERLWAVDPEKVDEARHMEIGPLMYYFRHVSPDDFAGWTEALAEYRRSKEKMG